MAWSIVNTRKESKEAKLEGQALKAFENIRAKMYARADANFYITIDSNSDRTKVESMLRRAIDEIMYQEASAALLSRAQKDAVVKAIVEDMLGYGPIQILLDDADVTEVMAVRWDLIYYEKNGRIFKSDITFRNEEHIRNVVQKIVGPIGRRIDEASPLVDARLPDGSRVNAVIPPVAIDGTTLTIRKFGKMFTGEDLLREGSIGKAELDLLELFVKGRLNILIVGGAGTGKTTLLNILSGFIPSNERIVTIEDSAELQLQQEHVVRLEARPPNLEGKGEITIRMLVKNALRMRPDRIIVGECRGGEALDMLQAMNTGHEGSITTIHANSPQDAVSRLADMAMMAGQDIPYAAIKKQIASAVDLIVQVARLRDGSRRIIKISEAAGIDDDGDVRVEDIFGFEVTGQDDNEKLQGSLKPTGYVPLFTKKLEWFGIEIPEETFKGGAHR